MEMEPEKGFLSLEQTKWISNLLIWGTMTVSFLIWVCMPKLVHAYHTGHNYYDGSKAPFLFLILLHLLPFLCRPPVIELHTDTPESKEMERRARKQWYSIRIYLSLVVAISVLAILIGVWSASI